MKWALATARADTWQGASRHLGWPPFFQEYHSDTACPFCKLMFDDAAGNMGAADTMAIKDIAELVAEALED